MTKRSLVELRKEYTQGGLRKADVAADPFEQFQRWFEAAAVADLHEPNAMTLATCTADGRPSARMVLLKGYDARGFVFYTNYESRKARELEENGWAALVFWWGALERQIRIEGQVARVPAAESDVYYNSRPRGSRLGAWASPQSQVIEARGLLAERLQQVQADYGLGEEAGALPRPSFWGGYRVVAHTLEFWQGRPNRLHDRLQYTRRPSGAWEIQRLAP